MSSETGETRWSLLLQDRRPVYLAMICLAISLHASNGLIVAATLPHAVAEIGGLTVLSWAVALYMVASVMSSAAGGRLKGALGDRTAFIAAAALFALGTLVCAAAPSMAVLLGGRLLQGLAGGAILALCHTLVRTLFPERLWTKVYALVSGVWGVSALTGPLVGGLFADLGHWRWSFLAMVPLAGLAIAMAAATLSAEGRQPGPIRTADVPGLRLALAGSGALLVAMAGIAPVWWLAALSVAAAMAAVLAAVRIDARSRSPLLPRDAFSLRSSTGLGLWIIFSLSISIYGFTTYGPLLLQYLHGLPALAAGYLVAWEALSWTIAAFLAANLAERHVPAAIVAGPALTAAGLVGISIALPAGAIVALVLALFLAGAGLGLCWAFVCRGIIQRTDAGDRDLAASAIPTTQMMAFGFGSALAGLIGNASGLADALTVETARTTAVLVHALFVPTAAAAVVLAIRFVRRTRGRAPL